MKTTIINTCFNISIISNRTAPLLGCGNREISRTRPRSQLGRMQNEKSWSSWNQQNVLLWRWDFCWTSYCTFSAGTGSFCICKTEIKNCHKSFIKSGMTDVKGNIWWRHSDYEESWTTLNFVKICVSKLYCIKTVIEINMECIRDPCTRVALHFYDVISRIL